MSVTRVQCLAFGGNVFSVTTLTSVLAAIWKENTAVSMPFYDTLMCSREGMQVYLCMCITHFLLDLFSSLAVFKFS